MSRPLVVLLVVLAPALAGCAILGPGSHYDVTVETESIGRVVAKGTPASNGAIFVSLIAPGASEPIPANRTYQAGTVEPGVLDVPDNASKLVARLRLDVQGEVRFRVPTGDAATLTVRIEESRPNFSVQGEDCPRPRKLRSTLQRFALDADETFTLPFYVVCDAG